MDQHKPREEKMRKRPEQIEKREVRGGGGDVAGQKIRAGVRTGKTNTEKTDSSEVKNEGSNKKRKISICKKKNSAYVCR